MQGWEGYLKHSICKKNKTKHDIYKAKHNKIKYACIKFFDSQLVPNSKYLYMCMHVCVHSGEWVVYKSKPKLYNCPTANQLKNSTIRKDKSFALNDNLTDFKIHEL